MRALLLPGPPLVASFSARSAAARTTRSMKMPSSTIEKPAATPLPASSALCRVEGRAPGDAGATRVVSPLASRTTAPVLVSSSWTTLETALTIVTTFCLPRAKFARSNSSTTSPFTLITSRNMSSVTFSPPASVTSTLTSPGAAAGSRAVTFSRPICALGLAASSLARALRGAGPPESPCPTRTT